MNVADDLLLLLRCPITRQSLVKAPSDVLDEANRMIHGGKLANRLGEIVDDTLDAGLIDRAGTWLYPVRDGIVCLLADEAISLDRLELKQDEAHS
ncbi:MAG: hypothetical protein ABI614_13630 [Planctomycetota bacterium]